jgi:hypothetical protein
VLKRRVIVSDTLEARVNAIEKQNKALENEVRTLNDEVRTLNDIEAIKKLQRAYSYYLEHAMYNEVADLWVDDGEMQWIGTGVFKGKETIRKLWSVLPGQGTPDLLHVGARFCPIITVAPDGKTAKGRWYVSGTGLLPIGKNRRLFNVFTIGIDENEYVKENGVWKFKVFRHGEIVSFRPTQYVGIPQDRIATPEDLAADDHGKDYPFTTRYSKGTPHCEYPSGYILPFHFKHPVTGKETSEAAHNAAMPPSTTTLF